MLHVLMTFQFIKTFQCFALLLLRTLSICKKLSTCFYINFIGSSLMHLNLVVLMIFCVSIQAEMSSLCILRQLLVADSDVYV